MHSVLVALRALFSVQVLPRTAVVYSILYIVYSIMELIWNTPLDGVRGSPAAFWGGPAFFILHATRQLFAVYKRIHVVSRQSP